MKQYWIGISGQVIAGLTRLFRDKMALFFTFLFPLIFLFVFGSIFNNQSASFNVAIINHAKTEFAKQFVDKAKGDETSLLKVKEVADLQDAKEKMKRSELDGVIELPEEFGAVKGEGQAARPTGTIRVLYAKGREQAATALTAVMEQTAGIINKHLGQAEPPFTVSSQAVGDEALKQFDYTFTGLLAFSLMSMGIFGLANQMPTEKQKGNYRRLRAAPFTSGQLIIATAIVYTIISLLSAAMMIAVGMAVFQFTMRGEWLLFIPFMTLASIMMVGMGLMIGAWAKNEQQSAPLSNLVSFPMMFLSGAFFPSFLFPEWLRVVSQFIPMTPVVDGFRMIMTEHASLAEVTPHIGGIVLCIIVVYALAIRLFRWE
ncbi:MAG: ABC transporter permease [Candidatus Saccharibacteria bacterium]|nr:ABC transporter permease [Candidatus Saccharibacteria bacterium]